MHMCSTYMSVCSPLMPSFAPLFSSLPQVVFGVAGTVGFVLAEWGVGSSQAAPRGIGDKDE